MKLLLFLLGIVILVLTEVTRVYYIMPFPGSQQSETIAIAYFIQSNLGFLRLLGIVLIAYPMFQFLKNGSRWTKVGVGVVLSFYLVIFYLFNFKFLAEKMFEQPQNKIVVPVKDSKVSGKQLVLGVSIHGEAKAYPIEIIGYHHQVRDTVGGVPIMVTYCTVCRTGRVFSPMVKGQPEVFRLVGMDHFNAMFEDSRTKSWWRQVNGEAVAGELKGQSLKEIPSEQMRLDAWVSQHENTYVMQPDRHYDDQYEELKNFDEGVGASSLTLTDTSSWKEKSWVVGVAMGTNAKAYDWVALKKQRVINDQLADAPLVVVMENDTVTFHVWKRLMGKDTLDFEYSDTSHSVVDKKTHSEWDWSGRCRAGALKGTQLETVQSYQEFWHSWRTFHSQTTQYTGKL